MSPSSAEIAAALLRLAEERGEKTFCPSEIARGLSPNWRALMPAIREEAERLVQAGQLRCCQSEEAASPVLARGPIRLFRAQR
ncbi:MAG: hypothetical protein AVDCRST_MAG42-2540 [uncultured Chthoniobacterales bacterium]|uniref:DUF3253 domain-containing protein n=1 Tax=uncultured Chthoniobacterales bacterium TaxID=1836801 RepID=A0A6J4IRX4_9BACT|nr:MAG: hypothetical protein AVDCRST_MAG42-2540 [uncultured Chthoniobacterales bacterium]